MIRKYKYLLVALLTTIGISSCGEDRIPEMEKKQETQLWVYDTLDEHYYWYEDMPELKAEDLWKNPKVLFESLLSDKDGNGKYKFSYIEDLRNMASTRGINNVNYSYGFDFYENELGNEAWVIFIQPDSPAEKAGLVRNDKILEINGKALTGKTGEVSYSRLRSGDAAEFTIKRDDMIRKIKIDSSTTVNNTPLLICKRMEGYSDLGYILYNHFSYDPDEYSNIKYHQGKYLKEMVAKVSALKGIKDLILDLRYNPGGELNTANTLISMICPSNSLDINLASLETNNKQKDKIYEVPAASYFLKENNATNLDIQNLYVLVSNNSASASEYLINALAPFMDVHVIGLPTVGKNVGSQTFISPDKMWRMHPIVIKIFNSLKQSEYSHGFLPGICNMQGNKSKFDYQINEGNYNKLFELGTNKDPLINKALILRMSGGFKSSTRAIDSAVNINSGRLLKASTVDKYGNNMNVGSFND